MIKEIKTVQYDEGFSEDFEEIMSNFIKTNKS
jgi:hypothetical protein